MISKMKENLWGMYWERGGLEYSIPYAGNTKNALYVFQQNLASITWNSMTTLENNPTTLPQTETILKGQSVSGISIDQLMQVKNYGDGAKKLIELLSTGTFVLHEATASALHGYVGKEDALTWGAFRNSNTTIRGVGYEPPDHTLLSQIANMGFSFLEAEFEPQEGAIAAFLFMARSQFFHDANKRTSSLMMNGYLMKNGFFPITVMNRDSEEFHTLLRQFYNTGNATDMMHFFMRSVWHIYPPQGNMEKPMEGENGGFKPRGPQ